MSRAALAALAVATVLVLAESSALVRESVPEPRTAFVSDVDGEYNSVFKLDEGCPGSVSVVGTVGDNGGIGRTPVENIKHDGVACSGGTMFTISETKARNVDSLAGTAGLANFADNLRKNGAALTAINQQETTEILVGNDDAQRTCGSSSWPEETFYLFVKESDGQQIQINTASGVETGQIPAGEKGLFIVSNDRRLCLLTANATKLAGEDESEAAGGAVGAGTSAEPSDEDDESEESASPDADASDEDDDADASDDDDDGSVCFPGDATVELKSGAIVPMSELVIGDEVKVGHGQFSPVFMFTHKLADAVHSFVVLTTSSGAKLSLTAGHYLYADGALVAAGSVRAGARVVLGDGSEDVVVSVGKRDGRGLFNPQTIQGNVVVNGVVSSTYTTAVEPTFAHAVLSPFRLFHALGLRFTALESGGGALAEVAPRGARTEL